MVIRKIVVNPNSTGSAIKCTLTGRTASKIWGKYRPLFEAQDGVGLVSLPYEFQPTPLVAHDGIRAETLTNCTAGSVASPKNGVMIYIE